MCLLPISVCSGSEASWMCSQADKMSGVPAHSAAAAAGKKDEEANEGDGKESSKPQPKGGAWWQWLLV